MGDAFQDATSGLFDIPVDITFSGERGERGRDGKNGKDGVNGRDGKDGADGVNGLNGLNGKDGKDGLNGANGRDGKSIKGKDGTNGADGLSAYEIWLEDGNDGTEPEFLKSLKGKDAKTPMYHGNALTELKELNDISILNPQEGDILVYNGTLGKWESKDPNPS